MRFLLLGPCLVLGDNVVVLMDSVVAFQEASGFNCGFGKASEALDAEHQLQAPARTPGGVHSVLCSSRELWRNCLPEIHVLYQFFLQWKLEVSTRQIMKVSVEGDDGTDALATKCLLELSGLLRIEWMARSSTVYWSNRYMASTKEVLGIFPLYIADLYGCVFLLSILEMLLVIIVSPAYEVSSIIPIQFWFNRREGKYCHE